MDMKPLFRESHSPTRYPFVWQSRAAKFYHRSQQPSNLPTGGNAISFPAGTNQQNPAIPNSHHQPSGLMAGNNNNNNHQHHHQHHPHHSHHQHHHHSNGGVSSSRSGGGNSSAMLPTRQVQHQYGQYSKSAKQSNPSTALPTSGSSLFSPSLYGDHSKSHSRRQFFPSPPAVAPKPTNPSTPMTMTTTITTSSAHVQNHHHHNGHHSGHHSQSQVSSVPFGANGLEPELSCTSSSSPTGGDSSSNYDHDDSQPFVRIGDANNRLNR